MSVGSIDEQQFDAITASFPYLRKKDKKMTKEKSRDWEILTLMTLLDNDSLLE